MAVARGYNTSFVSLNGNVWAWGKNDRAIGSGYTGDVRQAHANHGLPSMGASAARANNGMGIDNLRCVWTWGTFVTPMARFKKVGLAM